MKADGYILINPEDLPKVSEEEVKAAEAKWAEQIIATAQVEGFPLTNEARIIGALVKRLGGKVEFDEGELDSIQGIMIFDNLDNPHRVEAQ